MRILLVEDNHDLADGISRALSRQGYTVDHLDNGDSADSVIRSEPWDLLLLDLNLPGRSGFELLQRLRAREQAQPVLILTARDQVGDRVRGLDLGADDYLGKPFDLNELEARVRALLRRSQAHPNPVLSNGPLAFDTVERSVALNGSPLELPRRELAVLEMLLNKKGKVVNKEQMIAKLFGFEDEAGPNALETYVSRLRKKLKPAGITIHTVRGLGYLMDAL